MTRCPTRPRRGCGRSGTPRTSAPTCPRWSSRWLSPGTGSRSGAGPSRGTLGTPPSSAPSRTTWRGWNLHRMVWVADRGFASQANRAYLTRGGGHYIHAEKLRHTNLEAAAALARPGRSKTVAGNLRVKEVHVAPGGKGDGDEGARAVRFVICHNPEQAERDATVRTNLVRHLQTLIAGSDTWTPRKRDELVGSLKGKPGLRRFLRRTGSGLLRIDHKAITAEAHLDGKWLLRTSDPTLTAEDLAAAYKQRLAVENGWRG